MMIHPEGYLKEVENLSYLELIRERDELISYLQDFERKEMAGDRSDPTWHWSPSPDCRYQMFFDYLAEICGLMHRKYNEEYVWGGRTLKQDAEEKGNGS